MESKRNYLWAVITLASAFLEARRQSKRFKTLKKRKFQLKYAGKGAKCIHIVRKQLPPEAWELFKALVF